MPVCEECEQFFRMRPFPVWLRVASVGLFALVLFSLLSNLRFIRAYFDLKEMGTAWERGDLDRAASLATLAANRVPESEPLRAIAEFHEGIVLLREDKSRKALAKLRDCQGRLPEDWPIDYWILLARQGVAFDEGNYTGFLEHSQALVRLNPQDPIALGSVASAYACLYAQSGDAAYREKALEFLQKAKQSDEANLLDDYEMRIRHRLHTREIITADEFRTRFPTGWQEPGEEAS